MFVHCCVILAPDTHPSSLHIVVYEPRQRASSISIPVKSVSFKSVDYRHHKACAIVARLVSQLGYIKFIPNAATELLKPRSSHAKINTNYLVLLVIMRHVSNMLIMFILAVDIKYLHMSEQILKAIDLLMMCLLVRVNH